jgi:Protein of unknown function (DUF2852)
MNTSSAASADNLDLGRDGSYRKHSCSPLGKKRWSGAEIAAVVGGFIVFWPLGLLALGLKFARGEMWTGASQGVPPWAAYKAWKADRKHNGFDFAPPRWQHTSSSGNAAFDTYKKEQLDRLEAERRKLEDEQRAFADYLTKLREAKDKDEFDRFMAERNMAKPSEG